LTSVISDGSSTGEDCFGLRVVRMRSTPSERVTPGTEASCATSRSCTTGPAVNGPPAPSGTHQSSAVNRSTTRSFCEWTATMTPLSSSATANAIEVTPAATMNRRRR
jgi:hypothetical protein